MKIFKNMLKNFGSYIKNVTHCVTNREEEFKHMLESIE